MRQLSSALNPIKSHLFLGEITIFLWFPMVSSSCNLAMNHTTLPASPGVNGWCTSLSSTPPPIAWGTSWKALPGEGLGCPLFVGGRLYTVHTHTYMGVGQNLFIINSNGMNIHLPAILMFTRGTRFWHTAIYIYTYIMNPGSIIF